MRSQLTQRWSKFGRLLFAVLFCITSLLPLLARSDDSIAPLPTVIGTMAGSLAGTFNVGSSGAPQYEIPISLPPGINGMVPKLSVAYNGSSSDGLLGMGWSLSGYSVVTRCGTTTAQDGFIDPADFDDNDKFCLDGQRLTVVGGLYGASGSEYRTEIESFTRVISQGQIGRSPEKFLVYSRNGTISEYARRGYGRQDGTASYWLLSRQWDRSNNVILYDYTEDATTHEVLPSSVTFGGSHAVVRYIFVDRQFPRTTDASGPLVSARKKLTEIHVLVDGVIKWRYNLLYTPAPVSKYDRFTYIYECAESGDCLPGTEIKWGAEDAATLSYASSQTFNDLSWGQGWNQGFEVLTGDFTGDGISDIARADYSVVRIYRGSPTGLIGHYDLEQLTASQGCSSRLFAGDWNGDGIIDLAGFCNQGLKAFVSRGYDFVHYTTVPINQNDVKRTIVGDWNGDGRMDYALKTANYLDFSTSTGAGFASYFRINTTGASGLLMECKNDNDSTIVTGDWNGDGRTDVACVTPSGYVQPFKAITNGFEKMFTGEGTYSGYPIGAAGWNGGQRLTFPTVIGDWNGDGLADIGRPYATGFEVCYSSGEEFGNCARFDRVYPGDGAKYDYIVADFNHDGVSDIGLFYDVGFTRWLVRGRSLLPESFTPELSYQQGALQPTVNYPAQTLSPNSPVFMGDFNGDGFADIGRIMSNHTKVLFHKPSISSKVVGIVNGFGAQTNIEYKTITDPSVYSKGVDRSYPTVSYTSSDISVVSKVSRSNGIGGFSDTHYHYADYRVDLDGRGSSGFGSTTETDGETGISKQTWYAQTFPYKGVAFRFETRLPTNALLKSTVESFVTKHSPENIPFPTSSSTVEESYELSGELVQRTTTTRTHDVWGNVTRVERRDNDGYIEVTNNTLSNNTAVWMLGQLTEISVTKRRLGKPEITRTSRFGYSSNDTYIGSGLLLSEIIEPSIPSARIEKSYTYDSFGNKRTESTSDGVDSRTITYTYSADGRFLQSQSNNLGHQLRSTMNPVFGSIETETDINGRSSRFNYDPFGRSSYVLNPDGTESRTLYLYPLGDVPTHASYMVRVDSSGQPPSFIYFDILNREIRKISTSFDGRELTVDTIYNRRGEVEKTSEPYYKNGVLFWTTNEYDILGRVIRTTDPLNRASSVAYNGLTTIATDPLLHTVTRIQDSRGKVISLQDHLNGVMTFDYNSLGDLISLRDAAGNTTLFEYDKHGNRTLIDDPDLGVTQFSYNIRNELIQKIDTKQQIHEYHYDELGRLIRQVSPEGVTTWEFDTAANGLGELAKVTGPRGFEESYLYDAFGRLRETATKISGVSYVVRQSYDQYGRSKTLTYPTGFTVINSYNAYGYLESIKRPDGHTFWTANIRNRYGQIARQTYGNGLVSNTSYQIHTALPSTIQIAGVQDLAFTYDEVGNLKTRSDLRRGLTESFQYDALNRLKQSQVGTELPITVTYDALGNILTKSDIGTYSYRVDGLGGPHAVKSIVGRKSNTFQYDENGNRISSSFGSITYDSSNRPTLIRDGQSKVAIMYNPDGNRIEQKYYSNSTLTMTKVSLGDLYEHVKTGRTYKDIHYIKSPDGLIGTYTTDCGVQAQPAEPVESNWVVAARGAIGARVSLDPLSNTKALIEAEGMCNSTAPVIRYFHNDHLGSVQTISDQTGAVVEVLSYDSWGMRRDSNWQPLEGVTSSQTSRGFTGHEHLDSVGLIHMGGRAYDPEIGRFISPDPYVQEPQNMQNLNRYSYVLNNPLSATDPSGFFFKKLFRSIGKFFKRYAPMAIAIAISISMPQMMTLSTFGVSVPLSATPLTFSLPTIAISTTAASVASSVAGSVLNGGSFGDGLKAGFRAAPKSIARSLISFGVGEADLGSFEGAIAHGLTGAGLAVATGDSADSSFVSSFIGHLASPYGLEASVLAGGTAAALTGGKFQDGAMEAAFVHLFNSEAHKNQCDLKCISHVTMGSSEAIADTTTYLALYADGLVLNVAEIGKFFERSLEIAGNSSKDLPGSSKIKRLIPELKLLQKKVFKYPQLYKKFTNIPAINSVRQSEPNQIISRMLIRRDHYLAVEQAKSRIWGVRLCHQCNLINRD